MSGGPYVAGAPRNPCGRGGGPHVVVRRTVSSVHVVGAMFPSVKVVGLKGFPETFLIMQLCGHVGYLYLWTDKHD